MFNTPPANPAFAKPRRAASSSGTAASSVNEKARPRASNPLDALRHRWAGLLDKAHLLNDSHQLAELLFFDAFSSREPVSTSLENALATMSRSPRASSSSRTIRFGILP